jgi:hypothetical protein
MAFGTNWIAIASSRGLRVHSTAAPTSLFLDTEPVSGAGGGWISGRAVASGTVTFDYTIGGTNEGRFWWYNSGSSPYPTLPGPGAPNLVTNLVTTRTSASIPVQAGDYFGFGFQAFGQQFPLIEAQRLVGILGFNAPGAVPAPGPFPNTSVSAVNVIARGSSTAFNGNVEIVGYEGQGPIPWTVTKYNRGDIAMRLAPANPAAADANTLNRGFVDFTTPTDSFVAEAQSWRPHPRFGVIIPTARQNGPIDWGDGEGPFFPTVAISPASSGPGFDMVNGSFGVGNLDINLGRAGTHASSPEGNFGFSVAWFPYDAGWIGGNVGNPNAATGAAQWNGANEHSAGLVPSLMRWEQFPAGSGTYGGLGLLRLPGVNAISNGMVFATSSHGNSDVNIVGVAPTNEANGGSGWVVTIREDSALTGEEVATGGQFQFEFVYVPYTAQNLIGGYIEGTSGIALQSAGTFSIQQTGTGTYDLTIPGKRGTNGTLLLQVADFESGTSVPMASRAFLSYDYDDASGKFQIEVRNMLFERESELIDANFYFAWVDFAQPLAPPSGPRLRSVDQVVVADIATPLDVKEANLAVNTDMPEILITTIDQSNTNGFVDPTTGQPARQALVGYFYEPFTLTKIRGPFFILGNGSVNGNGQITRHDVKYNPVSHEYVVVGCARQYENNIDLVMIARVGDSTSVGEPLMDVAVFDGIADGQSYDDVSVAVSSANGNFILVAEHKVAGEQEGTYGALFDRDGAILAGPTRLDQLEPGRDEDDPDVIYLPGRDVFMYLSNTDGVTLGNRIVGSIIQTVPGGTGNLQVSGPEQSLSATGTGIAQGHPASIENPFNGEIITAFDTGGNDVATGELSYFDVGAGPTYTFAEARPPMPYLAGAAGNPFAHQHPQLDVDPGSGMFVLGYQARASTVGLPNGYVFSVLDSNGAVMPSQLGTPYYLIDAVAGGIETTVNFHNIKYDPFSDSFLAVAAAGGSGSRVLYLAAVQVTSSLLPEAPALTIQREGNNVVIRWPASATGYTLQASGSLSAPSWAAVGGAPEADGSFLKMTVGIGGGARFFRLTRN